MPEGLSFEQAGSMPLVALTAVQVRSRVSGTAVQTDVLYNTSLSVLRSLHLVCFVSVIECLGLSIFQSAHIKT